MICILHGYLLEGSGSNLWTRSVIQALCRTGETIHLVCQDPHPERYDFIAEAHLHHLDGRAETTLKREVPYAGRCIMHKPQLGDTLPVYVWDNYEEFARVVPMVDLPTDEVESYIARNVDVVTRIARDHAITVMHANHLVLMSVVAQRVGEALDIPYIIMPHGSALEYAVRPDARFRAYARDALRGAKLLLVSSPELGERVTTLYSDMPELESRVREVRVGVDTSSFHPVARAERNRNIERVVELLRTLPPASDDKRPDADAADKLRAIDWVNDRIVIYVGRLIEEKGVQHLVEAMPEIVANHPRARLIVAGHGPLRERLQGSGNTTFIGYLTHRELSWLFGCCDVGVFPSLVKESGPMVFLEALSSGYFPVATYFAGAKDKIDTVAPHLAPGDAEFMKVRPDPGVLTADLVRAVSGALNVAAGYPETLRRIAQEEYDWQPIAARLARTLYAVAVRGE
jgi:glycosyltransferase involved in cell wall biosynthesis